MPLVLDGTGSISGLSAGGLPDASVTNDEIVSLAAPKLTGDIAAERLLSALNASGSAPIYACRAWVNFNGTGTVAIRASGNVSSITDNGVGRYTVNLTTAMPDTNGAAVASGAGTVANPATNNGSYTAAFSTTSTVLVHTQNPTSNVAADPEVVTVAIFR